MNSDEPTNLTREQITNIISKVFFTQPGSIISRKYYHPSLLLEIDLVSPGWLPLLENHLGTLCKMLERS